MNPGNIERRLIKPNEIYFDGSGNSFYVDFIDDVEIVNVPNSFSFIKPEGLLLDQQQLVNSLLANAKGYSLTDGNLSEGQFFAYCSHKGSTRSDIPAEFFLGRIIKQSDQLVISGNVQLSLHGLSKELKPKLIGFEITEKPVFKSLFQGSYAYGTLLPDNQYENLIKTFQHIDKDQAIPHPGTKEYVRKGQDFRKLAETYQAAGLTEIPGAMFKAAGRKENKETLEDWTLVAVHPYYLEYHNKFGRRDELTAEQRHLLMQKYDKLFKEHTGPLMVVEEQSRVIETLRRLQASGRKDSIYFTITVDKDSSAFPFTTHAEFMYLLKQLGIENIKFVGGHDSGDKPYRSFDPLSGQTSESSGCLRGLANRLEKRDFPKVQTIPGYTYS